MALPLPPGLTPSEVAYLCEMELVTVIPRQRLESLDLLAVSLPLPICRHLSSIESKSSLTVRVLAMPAHWI
jgi:GINS complex subunit 2